ncbi:hypothetical protein QBC34DRAFT_373757 [Podospora aff. communis PSN243]|uniref:Cytoplasmic tRNA 2-thiolation protein 2 n=1 Tax=Podospora aff. communis PSN243 TaxID=3040156 RepID=A0AAV9H6H8_9PEZI|nr:hypothetical protein QBC34DRAFT_373757 [Podospora aff. communis PSN243]
MAGSPSLTRPCVKCKAQEATLDSRSQSVCRACFIKFISSKCIKQIGILGKELPTGGPTSTHSTTTRRYALGLSRGVSSTVLLYLLNENVEFQLAKARAAPFDLSVIHVDSSCLYHPSSPLAKEDPLVPLRSRYPRFTYLSPCLSTALSLPSIDWSALPPLDPSLPPDQRIRAFFNSLPTTASRADILRLFTRHILLSIAASLNAQALLLGHSTTALAELTLSETAKGRGFSLPWVINDGGVEHPFSSAVGVGEAERKRILVYHPLRDALRKELVTYATLVAPPLTGLVSEERVVRDGAVVSHKDLSIEEVMFRYFAEVEESYPSVVANVARTTGKLVRLFGNGGKGEVEQKGCGMCGVPLDGEGDERWRGELGIQDGDDGKRGRLCYGCERSTRG